MSKPARRPFKLTMLDVGQGECFFLDFPDDSFALVDGGPSSTGAIVEQMNARKGRRFQWAMATQWDADHIRGLITALSIQSPDQFIFPALDLSLVKKLVARLDPSGETTKVADALWAVVRANGIPQNPMWARQVLPGSGPDFNGWILSPCDSVRYELDDALNAKQFGMSRLRQLGNRASLASWFKIYGRTFFLSAEVESDQFEEVRLQFQRRANAAPGGGGPAADFIKLSHHGSANNNPPELFQHFSRSGATILTSAGGRYGHPSPLVLRDAKAYANSRPHCTRLGQACSMIIAGTRALVDIGTWVEAQDWNQVPNPGVPCYSDVTVIVSANGRAKLVTASTQTACPFL